MNKVHRCRDYFETYDFKTVQYPIVGKSIASLLTYFKKKNILGLRWIGDLSSGKVNTETQPLAEKG